MSEINTTYQLDVSEVLKALDAIDSRFEKHEEAIIRMSRSDPFKLAAQGAADLDKELSVNTKHMVEMEATLAAYREQIKQLTAEQGKFVKKLDEVNAAGKHDELKKELEAVQEKLRKVNESLGQTEVKAGSVRGMIQSLTGKFKEMTTNAGTSGKILSQVMTSATRFAGLLGAAVVAGTVAIYRMREGYLRMNDSLLAISGNQKDVTDNMDVLDQIASDLDVTLRQTTASFGLLSSSGIKPTKAQLISLGILAKELKADFVQFSEAIVSADKGQTDALAKLGVQAQVQGNKVQLSFRGVTTEFKKGSGESVAALERIVKQIDLTENSLSAGAGRFDFMDRLAKGFVDAEKSIDDASITVDNKAYPAFERLNKLLIISKNNVLDWAESFGVWIGVGWEHLKNDAMLLIAGFEYLGDLAMTRSLSIANRNFSKSKEAFDANRKKILEEEARLQANVGKKSTAELTSNATKLIPEDREALAAAKAQRTALLKAEKDLQDALLKLEKDYGKEKVEAFKDDFLKYLEEKKKLQLQEIDLEEKAILKLKQILAGARKGQFDKDNRIIPDKSVSLNEQEKAPFNFQRDLINEEEYRERAKFISDNERSITGIISTEYQKQLQETEYKYEQLFKLAKQSGIDITKLEKQKAKELEKIDMEHKLSKLDNRANQEMQTAELAVIRAQIDGRMSLEIKARQQLLEVERSHIKERIKIIEASSDPEAKARLAGLYLALAQIDAAQEDLSKKEKKTTLFEKFLDKIGLDKEQSEAAIEFAQYAAQSIKQSMTDLYNTLNQLSQQRIQRIDNEIDKKKQQVEAELDLNKQGLANNLDLRQKELEELKQTRKRALDDQKRTQKAQMIIESATQLSSLATASAKIFATLAGTGPWGVALAAGAVAAMFAAFGFAKVKAFQLVNQQQPEEYEFGGEVGGRRHRDGGTLIEAEKGEYVTNRKSTQKYYDLIEAINKDNQPGILDYLLTNVLDGTGVSRAEDERKEAVAFMQTYQSGVAKKDDTSLNELKAIRAELAEIKASNERIPKVQLVNVGPNKYAEVSPNGTIVRELPY
ncbi:hypothetical protein [Dyadobacter alkalitolerans]|uniref:hypothetical protein n=1 Tax=Dyadobacter alkalitolerans TaxID=492736 RepID=UPI00041ACFF0|nr:hypothetical protein [Dyadobacter alkalitolerans]